MAGFQKWVSRCFDNLIDPDKETEVAELKDLLYKNLVTLKKDFVLYQVLGDRPHKQLHLDIAATQIYEHFLLKAWRDGKIDQTEISTLAWIASALAIPKSQTSKLNASLARAQFASALARAMDDGEISSTEQRELEGIASAAGLSLPEFVRGFFKAEGERFLQAIFTSSINDKVDLESSLDRLFSTAMRIGLNRIDALDAIRPQAARVIEHALADAKQDGELSESEESLLNQMLDNFGLPCDVHAYITDEMSTLKRLTKIRQGRLPSLQSPSNLNLKAGELLHFYNGAHWEVVKQLKSGPSLSVHRGVLAITDNRLLFTSPTKSDSIGFGSIVSYGACHSAIEIQVKNKPTTKFQTDFEQHVASAVFQAALALANQSLVRKNDGENSRHITRDVRQRVWQRYGGQCADCGAANYLEFDHIVPVAKGGSNSDANVQLLCRKCNLQKSDMI